MEESLKKFRALIKDKTIKRDTLVKELDITRRSLDTYVLDCKDWDEPLDLTTISDLESKISKIQVELKKLNSMIFKYELAIEKFGG